ncbi:MAG TPA: hypothetical protein VFU43_06500 [Streptosporangiaceae bacterium]|nr:hypothetical protein [Streptosporangiaceae bacterium]
MSRPSARSFLVVALSLTLLLGGACVARDPRPATEPPPASLTDTPAVQLDDQPSAPLYGLVWQPGTSASSLSRLDPRTLLPVAGGRSLPVDRIVQWTMAPDHSMALFGPGKSEDLDPPDSNVYVIDLENMRQTAVIKAKAEVGFPRGALWLDAGRVLLLGVVDHYESVERGGVISAVSRPVLVATIVDVEKRRVVAQRRYSPGGDVAAVEPSRDGLVVMFQPTDHIGTVEVGRVDTRGGLHLVRLDRVTAGFKGAPHGGDVGSRQNVPGLTVDARGGRAYVVAAGSPVAEITLPGLSVSYHSLTVPGRAPSVLGMLVRMLTPVAPAATAKAQSGPQRQALWLGGGKLAVWGADMDFKDEDGELTGGSRPSGLQVIDTRDWSVRMLDPGVGRVVRAEGRLVTAGVTVRDAADVDRSITGDGVRIRTPGARRTVHLYAGRPFEWIQAYGRYAYVDITDPNVPTPGPTGYAVIDTRTGAVLGEHKGRTLPDLLR